MSTWVAPTPANPLDPQSWAPMYQDYAQRVVDILKNQGYNVSLTPTAGSTGPYTGSPVTPLTTYDLQLGEYRNLLAPQMGLSPEEAAKQFLVNQKWSSLPGGGMAPGGSEAKPVPQNVQNIANFSPAGAPVAGSTPQGLAVNQLDLFSQPAQVGESQPLSRTNLFSQPGVGQVVPNVTTPETRQARTASRGADSTLASRETGGLGNPTARPVTPETPSAAITPTATTSATTTPAATSATPTTVQPGSYEQVAQALGFYLPNTQAYYSPQMVVPTTNAIDQWLANLTNNTGWLTNLLEAAGYPTDATAAWQAMKEAAERSTREQAANLAEQFNVAGGRFSTSFGNAMTDFYNQANKDWNSTLAQMVYQSQEAARQRELAAGTTLANLGYQGASQLSAQNFQALMQQYQQALAAAQLMASGADTAAQQLAAQGLQGANATLNAAMQAALGMYGSEYNATNAIYNLQNSLLPMMMQYGLTGASSLGNLLNSWLSTGLQAGLAQYGISQEQLNNMYQEWLRTQPEYSPLLQYLYSAATGYPATYTQGYAPSQFGTILGGLGGLMGNLGVFLKLFGIGV